MKKTIITSTFLSLWLAFCFMSCHNRNSYEEKCETTLSINIDLPEDKVSIYDLFEDISIIKLETSKESIISNIDKIIFHNDSIFIMDKKQNGIFIFNSLGKYLNKLFNYGNGPEEYSDMSDFTINKFTNSIEILSAYKGFYSFGMDLKFKHKYPLINEISPAHSFAIMDTNTRVIFNYIRPSKIEIYNIKNKSITNKYFNIPSYIYREASLGGSFVLENNEYGNAIFNQPFSNTTYSITQKEFTPFYKWDFGKYNFNINYIEANLSQKEYDNTIRSNTFKNKYIYHITTNSSNNHIYLLQFGFGEKNELFTLLYDKKTKEYIKLKSTKEGNIFPYYPILTENYIYAIVKDSSVLKLYLDNIKEATKQLSTIDFNNDSNPILIKYKLKTNIKLQQNQSKKNNFN